MHWSLWFSLILFASYELLSHAVERIWNLSSVVNWALIFSSVTCLWLGLDVCSGSTALFCNCGNGMHEPKTQEVVASFVVQKSMGRVWDDSPHLQNWTMWTSRVRLLSLSESSRHVGKRCIGSWLNSAFHRYGAFSKLDCDCNGGLDAGDMHVTFLIFSLPQVPQIISYQLFWRPLFCPQKSCFSSYYSADKDHS